MFKLVVSRRSVTRRQALKAGALAAAVVGLRPSVPALAARPDALFELDLAGVLDRGASASAAGGWRSTAVLRAPRRFDLVGLRWAAGSGAEAQLRARRRGGGWTDWVTLHPTGDHAPDSGRVPAGTDPVFVGAADEFQLRLRGVPRELRARFVRALPTARLHTRLARRVKRRARATKAQAQLPSIILRAAWGADSVPPRGAPDYAEVHMAFVHHTVTANDYGPEDSAGIVLGIARYHRDSNGWNDIGYAFLVDKYGQIFEGRAGGIDQAVVGAQAQGWNSVSTGIATLGDFTSIPQTPEGLDAVARLIAWKLGVHAVPTEGQVTLTSGGGTANRYPLGTPVTFERISGHRDGGKTSCPGDLQYTQLAQLRTMATHYSGPTAGITVRTPGKIRGVKPVDVTGSLRFADGSSAAGATVAVEYLPAGARATAAWATIASAAAAPDGTWRTPAEFPGSGQVRAVFPGDGARGPLASAPRSVTILARLNLSLSRSSVRKNALVRLSGTADPATHVQLTIERRVGRRWIRKRRRLIKVRNGAYSLRFRAGAPGKLRVSVQVGEVVRRRTLRVG